MNTRPIGLVFKQHPRDPANVNAWKNMCDPYSGLQILLHDVISLPDVTSYDKKRYGVNFLCFNQFILLVGSNSAF